MPQDQVFERSNSDTGRQCRRNARSLRDQSGTHTSKKEPPVTLLTFDHQAPQQQISCARQFQIFTELAPSCFLFFVFSLLRAMEPLRQLEKLRQDPGLRFSNQHVQYLERALQISKHAPCDRPTNVRHPSPFASDDQVLHAIFSPSELVCTFTMKFKLKCVAVPRAERFARTSTSRLLRRCFFARFAFAEGLTPACEKARSRWAPYWKTVVGNCIFCQHFGGHKPA